MEQREPAEHGRKELAEGIGGDLVIPLIALGFTAYFFVSIDGLQWEARANGTVIGAVLVALVVLQIVRSCLLVHWGEANFSIGPLYAPGEGGGRRLALIAILSAFVWFIEWTGTTLGLALMMLSSMWVMGVRDWRWLTLVSVGVAAIVCGLFIYALGTNLPAGPVEHGISALFGGSL